MISNQNSILKWTGYSDNTLIETDYDTIDDFINYNEGELGVYEKDDNIYYLLFSYSQKLEVIKYGGNIYILDGLYFDQSISSKSKLEIENRKSLDLPRLNSLEGLYIFHAAEMGSDLMHLVAEKEVIQIFFQKNYSINRVEVLLETKGHNVKNVVGIEFLSANTW